MHDFTSEILLLRCNEQVGSHNDFRIHAMEAPSTFNAATAASFRHYIREFEKLGPEARSLKNRG